MRSKALPLLSHHQPEAAAATVTLEPPVSLLALSDGHLCRGSTFSNCPAHWRHFNGNDRNRWTSGGGGGGGPSKRRWNLFPPRGRITNPVQIAAQKCHRPVLRLLLKHCRTFSLVRTRNNKHYNIIPGNRNCKYTSLAMSIHAPRERGSIVPCLYNIHNLLRLRLLLLLWTENPLE